MTAFEQDITASVQAMEAGGLILYPTDTIWGIGCDATNAAAVEKIFRLKQRADEKAMIILVADKADVQQYVADPDPRVFDYLQTVSKPTTVIYEGAKDLATNLVGRDGTIAIRICSDPFCRELIRRMGKPLVSTSANSSGEPSPRFFAEVSDKIVSGVDYVVHYRQDETVVAASSSIIRWEKDGRYTVIRP